MGCELRDELGSRYLAALNLVCRAQHRVHYAVTLTNIECANTELRRVEQYRLDVLRQIDEHCESHDCATEQLEEICGRCSESQTGGGVMLLTTGLYELTGCGVAGAGRHYPGPIQAYAPPSAALCGVDPCRQRANRIRSLEKAARPCGFGSPRLVRRARQCRSGRA